MSILAALLCAALVLYLFWQDRSLGTGWTDGLWVPLCWMFLAGSRWVSSWFDLRPLMATAEAYSEGSPVDRLVFLFLIVAGLAVLARRRVEWGRFASANALLVAYFAYCLVSSTWADDPIVAFKRWIKDMGNPIMALIILTSPEPVRALTATLRRLSYLLLPLSVLFVKYFPDLGRVYHVDGSPMYTGVGHQKNDLGLMCLVTGLYFAWQLTVDRERFLKWSIVQRWSIYVLVAMLGWLLYMSNSQTSLMCLMVGVVVMLGTRFSFVQRSPKSLVAIVSSVVILYVLLDSTLGVRDVIFRMLGRDPTLTNRTELWALLIEIGNRSALLGSGFMSFWAGERMDSVWNVMGAGVNQAHSGYIEQYLNLGFVGVSFIALLLLQALARIRSQSDNDLPMASLRLCFLLAAVLYNYTEASFYGINNMWILTLVAFMGDTKLYATANAPPPRKVRPGRVVRRRTLAGQRRRTQVA